MVACARIYHSRAGLGSVPLLDGVESRKRASISFWNACWCGDSLLRTAFPMVYGLGLASLKAGPTAAFPINSQDWEVEENMCFFKLFYRFNLR